VLEPAELAEPEFEPVDDPVVELPCPVVPVEFPGAPSAPLFAFALPGALPAEELTFPARGPL
jgi:hypothetical protein